MNENYAKNAQLQLNSILTVKFREYDLITLVHVLTVN